jgi:hypothetical protein
MTPEPLRPGPPAHRRRSHPMPPSADHHPELLATYDRLRNRRLRHLTIAVLARVLLLFYGFAATIAAVIAAHSAGFTALVLAVVPAVGVAAIHTARGRRAEREQPGGQDAATLAQLRRMRTATFFTVGDLRRPRWWTLRAFEAVSVWSTGYIHVGFACVYAALLVSASVAHTRTARSLGQFILFLDPTPQP